MGQMLYSEITDLALYRAAGNVTTDAPVAAAELLIHANDAYADVWEASGGGYTKLEASGLWISGDAASVASDNMRLGGSGTADIHTPINVFANSQADQSITCVTSTSVNVTSAALFGSVKVGMHFTGAGVSAGTYVVKVTDTSNIVISQATTTGTSAARTFAAVGDPITDTVLDPADYGEIVSLNAASGLGTYAAPQKYALVRKYQTTDTDGNRYDLYWWPRVAGFYFPMHFIKQFDPFDGGASDVPDVDDLWSRDLALLLAMRIAPLIGRAELVPSIAADVSLRAKAAMDRKFKAMLSADQDR